MKKYMRNIGWLSGAILIVLTLLGITPLVGLGVLASKAFSGMGSMLLIGSVGIAPGSPDYTEAGLNKLIPVLFSGEARENFYQRTCLTEITNTRFTNEIKNMGDKVVIPTDPHVTSSAYVKGQLLDVEYLESPAIEYTVDYARSFNFAVDDVDQKQFKIKDWVSRYAGIAAKDTKIAIERHFLSAVYADADTTNAGATAGALSADINLGTTGTPVALTSTNVTDYIADCAQCLSENDVPEEDRWMVIPAFMHTLLMKSEYKDAAMMGTGQSAMLRGRTVAPIHGFNIYVSNLLYKEPATVHYHLLFGHKEATSFVSQFVKTEKYRPERAFADAMKGLNVYGFKTVQPLALGEGVIEKG